MKQIALGLIVAALALSASSAARAKLAKSSKAKSSAETAAFKISMGTPQNVAELAAHFQEIDKKLQSLSARFVQSLTMPDAGISQRVEGNLEYLKPDRLHMEHYKPERQTVVSDGDKLWIYRVGPNQVVETSLADWRKSDPLINNLLDFSSYSKLLDAYDVSYDSGTLLVTLRPKQKTEEPFILKLKLSGAYLFPMETELDVAKTKVRTVLSEVHFNPKIPDSRFRFKPPAGAEMFEHFKPPVRAKPSP